MDWQNKEMVMRACAIGEMATILIKAMEWEKDYKQYKKSMFEYINKTGRQ